MTAGSPQPSIRPASRSVCGLRILPLLRAPADNDQSGAAESQVAHPCTHLGRSAHLIAVVGIGAWLDAVHIGCTAAAANVRAISDHDSTPFGRGTVPTARRPAATTCLAFGRRPDPAAVPRQHRAATAPPATSRCPYALLNPVRVAARTAWREQRRSRPRRPPAQETPTLVARLRHGGHGGSRSGRSHRAGTRSRGLP